MALASDMAWEGFSTREAASPSIGTRQALFWSVAAGAVLVFGALAAPAILSRMHASLPQRATVSAPAPRAPTGPASASRSSFEQDAESFLSESLALEAGCDAGCSRLASVAADAAKFVRLGIGQPSTALTLGRSFGPSAGGKPAAAPAPPASPAAPAPATPVRLVTAPVVVPLAPLPATELASIPAPVPAPIPAPRLDRPAAETPSSQQASIPPVPAVPAAPAAPAVGRNDGVAVYDISAAVVYMPDGQRLEAHSGLGSMVDDPRYVDRRDVGPTPPNTYNLVMRKGRFHGVDAVRLIPADGNNKYGRIGLLAHPYMLRGRPGESNGCVVFKDYNRFLDAFMRGKVKRMVVVASLKGSPQRVAAAT